MKKISILIAHYNNYGYFKVCYSSILSNNFENFEIIIVDDFSSEESFEKIKILTKDDNRVKLYRNDKNSGVGFTKSRCVKMATGDICAFIDPDDAITKVNISEILGYYNNEMVVAVYSKFTLCNDNLKPLKDFPKSKQIKNNNRYFFNISFEVNHLFTFRKAAYDKTEGINPSLSSAVDQDLYLKLYDQGDFIFINKPYYQYRLHDKGVSQETSKKEKLNKNWHNVLYETCKRRNINKLYGKNLNDIENLPTYIFKYENTILKKIIRKLS